MGAAIRERENVMHFSRWRNPALAPAHLAQRMRRDIPAPDGWPHAVVPVFHLWRPLISVVPGGDQPLMLRAVRFIGQGRAEICFVRSRSTSAPGRKQAFHHIIMGRRALILHRAILLDHLIDLIPQVVRLFGKRLAHGDIRGRDGVLRCGAFGQESEFRDTFLALNPGGDRHGVLFQDLLGDQVRTIALGQPLPGLGITCIPATKNRFTALPVTAVSKRRVAAYARVSTDSDEQFTSYTAQIDYYPLPALRRALDEAGRPAVHQRIEPQL